MRSGMSIGLALGIVLSAWMPEAAAQAPAALRVAGEQTVTGLAFPEAVAYDPQARVLYVSQFGSELKPLEKDGKGKIGKLSLDGKVLEDRFLPPAGVTLHKPKGMWVDGKRLWVTDIDAVWVFDLDGKRGKKLDLPGIKFANDVMVADGAAYVSDNRGDQVYRVEPADFLDTSAPRVTVVLSGKSVHPNGLYPAKDGSVLMVGFLAPDQPRGIYALTAGGEVKPLSGGLGRLDGVYPLDDGTLLVTDWRWPGGARTAAWSRWRRASRARPISRWSPRRAGCSSWCRIW